MKLLIIGHARHGKDTVAEILAEFIPLTFESSSQAACELVVYPALANKYGYSSPEECFADRANHRQEWRELIEAYNTPDKSRLCREILEKCDCYVGMRHNEEYKASSYMFDHQIWVDARERHPLESSMDIKFDDESMIYIDNNGTLDELKKEVYLVAKQIIRNRHPIIPPCSGHAYNEEY